ncbi:hypothetical protein GCM10018987_52740 [Streptomyces cremeus]
MRRKKKARGAGPSGSVEAAPRSRAPARRKSRTCDESPVSRVTNSGAERNSKRFARHAFATRTSDTRSPTCAPGFPAAVPGWGCRHGWRAKVRAGRGRPRRNCG